MQAKTVLYIEDNTVNLTLMQLVLGALDGLEIVHAPDAEQGIAMAHDCQPDLILSDLHMPGINGIEGVRRLKADADTRDIPVIMISSDFTTRNIDDALRAGCLAFLPKPFDVPYLMKTVTEILEPMTEPQP